MNFGDILDKWEAGGKRAVEDKDAEAQKSAAKKNMARASYIQKLAPQDSIDLHGMTQDQAW